MRIAVTGGAGFIGSHLVERLLGAGHRVLCVDSLDRFYPAAVKLANLSIAVNHKSFHLSVLDLREELALAQTLREFAPEVVYHLAATAGVRPSIERPMEYIRANVEASQSLLAACQAQGVERIVMAGSSSVYGRDQSAPFVEDTASPEPQSPYAATKRAMELLGAAHVAVHGATITICRLFTVYGPRQRPDLAISRFVRAMLADKPIRVFGDGSFARDFTYVSDTVEGLIACLGAPSGYQIFNLGGGRPVSVLELVSTIERVMGKQALVERAPEQKGDVPLTYASVEKASAILGWQAHVTLEAGVRKFVDWVAQAPDAYFKVGEPWALGGELPA